MTTGFFEGNLAEASRQRKPLPFKEQTMLPEEMYRDPRKTDFVVLETIFILKTSSDAHIKIQTISFQRLIFCLLLDVGDEVYDDVDASDFPAPPPELM